MDSPPTSTIAAPSSNISQRGLDGAVPVEVDAAVREGVGRDVDDAHDDGPGGEVESAAVGQPQGPGRAGGALEGRLGARAQARRQGLQALGAPGPGQNDRPRARALEAHDVHRKVRGGEGRRAEPVPGRDLAQRFRVRGGDDEIGGASTNRSLTRGNGRLIDVLGIEDGLRVAVEGQRDHGAPDGDRRRDLARARCAAAGAGPDRTRRTPTGTPGSWIARP